MININNIGEREKAKILLDPNNKDVLKVNNIRHIYIQSISMSSDIENIGSLDVDISFKIINLHGNEIPQLDPNKQYVIAEVE